MKSYMIFAIKIVDEKGKFQLINKQYYVEDSEEAVRQFLNEFPNSNIINIMNLDE